ncbi:MAG: hydrolase TatD [Verrucomicrobia bacterium]|jgi:TatD DNase family protein|nr:hydrolase TatD [Verrucomicrobiota bacterium]
MMESQTMPSLIDIGLNLTHDSFDHDRKEVLQRALDSGVKRMVLTGSSEEGSHKALKLAKAHPGTFYATAGIHPHHAKEVNGDTFTILSKLHSMPEIVAVGECGLDYFRDISPRTTQEKVFITHLEMAMANQLPMFLHQRDSGDAFISILKDYREKLSDVVVHCFTDDKKVLFGLLDLECHIGITGWICDERRGKHLKELVPSIPVNRLMIETDAPYLMPRDLDPKPKTQRNEPMHLLHIAREIAKCTGKSFEQLAQETTASAESFFKLPPFREDNTEEEHA